MMNTIRFSNNKKRWEVIVRYFMYQVFNIFLVEIIASMTKLDHMALEDIIIYVVPDTLKYSAIIVIPLTFRYGGNRVVSIEYDYDNKVLDLCHYNWLFCRRQKQILWENLNYGVYHIRQPYLYHKVTLIMIRDKNAKRSLVFASGLGWKRKQLDEIADKLKEIKEPVFFR